MLPRTGLVDPARSRCLAGTAVCSECRGLLALPGLAVLGLDPLPLTEAERLEYSNSFSLSCAVSYSCLNLLISAPPTPAKSRLSTAGNLWLAGSALRDRAARVGGADRKLSATTQMSRLTTHWSANGRWVTCGMLLNKRSGCRRCATDRVGDFISQRLCLLSELPPPVIDFAARTRVAQRHSTSTTAQCNRLLHCERIFSLVTSFSSLLGWAAASTHNQPQWMNTARQMDSTKMAT